METFVGVLIVSTELHMAISLRTEKVYHQLRLFKWHLSACDM